MQPSELSQFERSYCNCTACRTVCRVQPGALAPGDFDQILNAAGKDCDDSAFVYGHFVADHDSDTRTPLIRPAQHQDGRCVFLQDDGRCSTYRVAPFGCSRQSACREINAPAQQALLASISENLDYQWTWEDLASNGRAATSAEERAAWLRAATAGDAPNPEEDRT